MKRLILVPILTLLLGSCYKMPEEPESLKDEYLNVADFIAYYSYHAIDVEKVKIKGEIDKENYNKFLNILEQIKDDTSATNGSEYIAGFRIYDSVYGKNRSIGIELYSNIQIDKADLFAFFYRHADDNFVYIYAYAYRENSQFPMFSFLLCDTTEIIFKNPI